MLSRFSDALQTAADVLAPPPTRLEDFEYHWKMILNFYQTYDDSSPCLEAVVQRSICMLDALTALAAADRPPGARALALSTGTALLRRTRQPCVNSAHVYRPLQRMLIQCNENPASPTEKEEVELLLTLCGLVRQEPGLANIFTTPFVEDKSSLLSIPEDIQKLIPIRSKKSTPKKNSLFEVDLPPNPLQSISIIRTNSRDDYGHVSNSSVVDDNVSVKSHKTDNQVVLRACEGIMIVSSLPEDDIANLVTTCSPACETIIDKLASKYKSLPANIDPGDVDHLNITWAYVAQDFGDKSYNKFHEGAAECGVTQPHHAALVTAILSKCLRALDSPHLINEGAAECGVTQPYHAALVTAILSKCLRALDSPHLINEHSIHRLVLARVVSRGYYASQPPLEEDERDRLNDAMKQLQHEDHVNDQITDILTHEGLWLDITSSFHWPEFWTDTAASSTHSYDSRPEADIHRDDLLQSSQLVLQPRDLTTQTSEEEFDEGPFLKMIFKLLSNMPAQPYQVNLHLTSIVSKLALLPHPNVHEYLLNPMLPTAKKTQTLFKTLQELAKKLTLEIPRLRNYKKPEHNWLVESLIVLEEFCKELAAIAFVKYQHSVHIHR
ncbi:Uncharacterized protein OBRU01_10276 [Operophtera brumata]|uniref:FHF complex subunit HOOK-interacting protein C-terminal domain-containing protein n=1 Tax=Operophtera brumata TaxID=104452 RepID=A0A0L7LDV4_OPEBR|nr:Uncharacterized protein OBRU01_10276 [Operophtera brumata]